MKFFAPLPFKLPSHDSHLRERLPIRDVRDVDEELALELYEKGKRALKDIDRSERRECDRYNSLKLGAVFALGSLLDEKAS